MLGWVVGALYVCGVGGVMLTACGVVCVVTVFMMRVTFVVSVMVSIPTVCFVFVCFTFVFLCECLCFLRGFGWGLLRQ